MEARMGLFKQMKDMKQVVGAAPDLVSQAQQMGEQAQQMAAAQQAAAQQAAAQQQAAVQQAAAAGGPEFEPIAGVSLELYAEISRESAAHPGDLGKAGEVAASRGVSAENWQQAMNGWNARMQNPVVAQRFNQLYTGG
jgi:hypothetical protein